MLLLSCSSPLLQANEALGGLIPLLEDPNNVEVCVCVCVCVCDKGVWCNMLIESTKS